MFYKLNWIQYKRFSSWTELNSVQRFASWTELNSVQMFYKLKWTQYNAFQAVQNSVQTLFKLYWTQYKRFSSWTELSINTFQAELRSVLPSPTETEPHICTTQKRTSVKQRTEKTKQAVSDREGREQTTCSTDKTGLTVSNTRVHSNTTFFKQWEHCELCSFVSVAGDWRSSDLSLYRKEQQNNLFNEISKTHSIYRGKQIWIKDDC